MLPIIYIFAMIHVAFITMMPGKFITHLETTPGLMGHIGLALFSYMLMIIAALCFIFTQVGVVLLTLTFAIGLFMRDLFVAENWQ